MDNELTGVAIVGMAGRFPGARNLGELWEKLLRGEELISRFSREELRAAGVPEALADDPRYVAAGGVLAEADLFDARLFGFTPREAAMLDPQHRQFLECAWEALEDAGCDPGRFAGAIGVFAGEGLPRYLLHNLMPAGELERAEAQTVIGNDKDFLATRLSYKLDLKGPSLDIQTACSTALVSITLACQSLLNFQCDLALAGGVAVREPQTAGYLYEDNGILSPDGHCRPFDAQARGTVPGSGVGVVALKRLEDALADGDSIHAVIRGAAINNDGAAKAGFTAPSVSGQEEVLRTALAIAGVSPREVGFVEAHGTATALGDPIEFRALSRVFAEETDERSFCALGSIKSNLGHTDAAAGVAGLIKAALALEHRTIPPTLHFERPNPEIDLAASPFFVNAAVLPWAGDGRPRRAGVSSFGIGGTNAHVVLEEAPAAAPEKIDEDADLLLLSANDPAALDAASRRLADHLERHPGIALASVARTLRLGRQPLPHRRAVIAGSTGEAREILAALDGERMATGEVPKGDPAVAFLLPGQGIELGGISAPLYRREPVYRAALDACAEGLAPHLGLDLRVLLHPRPGEDAEAARRLAGTALAQPALFSVSYALAQVWIAWGVEPRALLGHSLGEYTAAALAGVFTLPAALRLVAARGRLAASLPAGAMLSVALAEAELTPLLPPGVSIAALNAPDRTVATGSPAALAALAATLAERGVEGRPLPVDHAFHSADVEPLLDAWRAEVARTPLSPPRIPYLSNVTGGWIRPEEATDPAYWAAHLRQPVRFAAALGELLADPARVLLEVGPGQTLTAFARRHPAAKRARLVAASLPPRESATPADQGLLATLGRLWIAGVAIDGAAVHPGRGRTVHLPTYPFARERHWIDRPAAAAPTAAPRADAGSEAAVAGWTVPLWREELPPRPLAGVADAHRAQGARWIVWTDRGGLGAQLLKRLRELRLEAIGAAPGPGFARASDAAYTLAPDDPEGFRRLLAAAAEGDERPLRLVYLWSLDGGAAGAPGLEALSRSLPGGPAAGRISLDLGLAGTASWSGEPASGGALELLALAGRLGGAFPCRLFDLEPPSSADSPELPRLVERLLAELVAAPAGERVALRGRRRFVERLAPFSEAPTAAAGVGTGAILLAGDDGALGTALADRLAGGAGPRVVWVGPPAPGAGQLGLSPADGAVAGFEAELAGRIARKTPAEIAALDDLAVRSLVEAFRDAGVAVAPGAETTVEAVRQRFRLLPRFERFLQFFLHTLEGAGVVEQGGGQLRFTGRVAALGSAADLARRITAERPHLAGLTGLLAHCVAGYGPAFSGEVEALSILFPGGSTERLHQALADAEGGTEEPAFPLLTEVVRDLLARWPGGPLRILEVGAGQGILTRALLPLLAGRDVEYHFTDIARTFVLAAERDARERGQRGLKRLRFGVLDISRDPVAQGFRAGAFHLVLAANVIHAAPRIAPAVEHLARLLAPGGLLALIENVEPRPWADMIWGLSDGWWHFEDTELRATSPLLPAARWQEVFRAAGLERTGAWPRHPALAGTNDAALLLAAKPAGDGDAPAVPTIAADPGDPQGFPAALAQAEGRLAPLSGAVWVGDPSPAAARFSGALPAEVPMAWVGRHAAALPSHAAYAEARGRAAWALAGDDSAALAAALATALTGAEWPLATAWRKPEQESPPVEVAAEARPEIVAQAANRPTLSTAFVAPRNDTEEAIAAIWSRALGIEPIGAFDNFLDLGGDSLVGLQVARALGERFDFGGRRFSLFENPTIAAVARFLAAGETPTEEDDGFAERAQRGARRRELQRGRRGGG